jgi:hypothetical protein
MIPPKVIRFLNETANTGFGGTCTRNLVPTGYRVSGWHVDPTGRTLTALIPDPFAASFVEAVRDNKTVAFTFEDVTTAETYQLKGQYVSHRPVTSAEADSTNRLRDQFARHLSTLYQDPRVESMVKAAIATPALAVDVEVREVFVQTPGPGAGARIAPAPEAEAAAR